jgi:DNA-binding winged helix-turn-helix (wHTH) protein
MAGYAVGSLSGLHLADNQDVYIRGERLNAQIRIHRLIAFLARSEGTTVSHADIQGALRWSGPQGFDSLRVGISTARKALRNAGAAAVIVSVPRIGYRLELR